MSNMQQQGPYMHGTPHPQNPNVYVQQMAPQQMNMMSSQQQNPYGMQAVGSPMMAHQLNQQAVPGLQGPPQQQGQMQQSPNVDPQMMRFVRPQQQMVPSQQSSSGPGSQAPQHESAQEPSARSAPSNEEAQSQQQTVDSASSTAQKAAPVVEPTAETMGFKNLDQYGPLSLCTLGKDVTREIVNQSVEFFKVCKSLQLPYQHPQAQGQLAIVKANLEKQDRSQKNFTILFERLAEISAKVDEQYQSLVPVDETVQIQNFIPFADEQDHLVNKFKETNPEYDRLKLEHQQTKELLQRKQNELNEIMNFLAPACWDASNILSHLNS